LTTRRRVLRPRSSSALQRAGVLAVQAGPQRRQLGLQPIDPGQQLGAVLDQDVAPHSRVRGGHPGGVAQAGGRVAGWNARLQHVGVGLQAGGQRKSRHVGQMAAGRHEQVVSLGIQQQDAGAQRLPERPGPFQRRGPGERARTDEAGFAGVQVGVGRAGPAGLPCRQGMAADEAIGQRGGLDPGDDRPLHAANVDHQRVRGDPPGDGGGQRHQAAHRR
jgi:hypothetical protein